MNQPSSIPPPPKNNNIDTLIIVCAHAIWLGGPTGGADGENEWLLEDFQRGETPTFIKHVEAGVRELAGDENAILVFSGGATKRDRTEMSEAEGYFNLAVAHNLFGLDKPQPTTTISTTNTSPPASLFPPPIPLRHRIFQDRFATDSYQNVLCSLIQFPIFVSSLPLSPSTDPTATTTNTNYPPHFPKNLTIISHDFKRARFQDLHLRALKFPLTHTHYIGIDPPLDPESMAAIVEGDRLRGYGAWKGDLYGNQPLLAGKRERRGWDEDGFVRVVLGWFTDSMSKERLERLLRFNEGEGLFPERLPWEGN